MIPLSVFFCFHRRARLFCITFGYLYTTWSTQWYCTKNIPHRENVCVCVWEVNWGQSGSSAAPLHAACLLYMYMISCHEHISGQFINRLLCSESTATSKAAICDRKHQVVAVCRTRLLWKVRSWNIAARFVFQTRAFSTAADWAVM